MRKALLSFGMLAALASAGIWFAHAQSPLPSPVNVIGGAGGTCADLEGDVGGTCAATILQNMSETVPVASGADLGTAAHPVHNIVFNVQGTYGIGYYTFIGTPTAQRALTLRDLGGTVAFLSDIPSAPQSNFQTLTDGSTVAMAIGSSLVFNAILQFTVHGGSRTLNITGPANGGNYVIEVVQDGTGGEGLTLGTGCTWKVINGGSGAITPSTGANAIDVLAFTYDGTFCLTTFGKNYN